MRRSIASPAHRVNLSESSSFSSDMGLSTVHLEEISTYGINCFLDLHWDLIIFLSYVGLDTGLLHQAFFFERGPMVISYDQVVEHLDLK